MEIDRNGLEVLTRAECLRMLATGRVGRVVVTEGALPAAFPVNFVVLDDDVVFATRGGTKLEEAAAGHVVAFEVDNVDRALQTGWSVLIRGRAGAVDDTQAVALVRSLGLAPWTGGTDFQVVRVRSEIMSGRRLVPGVADCVPFQGAVPAVAVSAFYQ